MCPLGVWLELDKAYAYRVDAALVVGLIYDATVVGRPGLLVQRHVAYCSTRRPQRTLFYFLYRRGASARHLRRGAHGVGSLNGSRVRTAHGYGTPHRELFVGPCCAFA